MLKKIFLILSIAVFPSSANGTPGENAIQIKGLDTMVSYSSGKL